MSMMVLFHFIVDPYVFIFISDQTAEKTAGFMNRNKIVLLCNVTKNRVICIKNLSAFVIFDVIMIVATTDINPINKQLIFNIKKLFPATIFHFICHFICFSNFKYKINLCVH